jgi:hypothetical protein
MTSGVSQETGRSPRFIDRAGERVGRLTYLEFVGTDKHSKPVYRQVCDCGTELTRAFSRRVQSCGCLQKEFARDLGRSHRLPCDEERKRRHQARRAKVREDRRNCPIKLTHARISRLLRHGIARVNGIKNSSTFEMLGYTPADLCLHLERQFTPGMGWHNMSEWQIDHIVPMSTARNEGDVIKLNELANLRPLWKEENNRKKDRLEFLI